MLKTNREMPIACWMIIILACIEYTHFMDLFNTGGNYFRILCFIALFAVYFNSNRMKGYKSTAFTFFTIWTFIIIFRGSLLGQTPPDVDTFSGILKYALSFPHSVFALLIPIIAQVTFKRECLFYFKGLALLFSILFIYQIYVYRMDIWGPNSVIGLTTIPASSMSDLKYLTVRRLVSNLYIGGGLIFTMCYCYNYIKRNYIYGILPFTLILLFATSAGGGGRGTTLLFLGYIGTMIFLMYKFPITKSIGSHIMNKIFVILIVAGIVFGLFFLYNKGLLDFFQNRLFENGQIGGTLNESTREEYLNSMIRDFNDDPISWIIGRGLNGSYQVGGENRQYIEWGYMWMILNGGIIWLSLYLYLLIKGFYIGLFKSNNLLCKAIAFLCIWQALSLIPFGLPSVSVHYFLVWHLWGVLIFTKLRYYSDQDLMPYFSKQ